MPEKQLIFDENARQSLMSGVDQLGRAVALTLGPSGRNVILGRVWTLPVVCSDGVTIAKEIELPDPYENMGAQVVKEAASKTNDVVGDGTTTSIVLARSIIQAGFMNVAAGANPLALKSGIDQAVSAVCSEISDQAAAVESREQVARVAALSAHEEAIAELIADAMDKVGREGIITVEESRSLTDELDVVEGMRLDRGYLSPHFVTDTDRMECSIEEPLFLLTDQKLSSAADVVPTLEAVAQGGRRPSGHHRRGRGGRSPGHAGGQQAARHHHQPGRKGPRLRRAPQGPAGGPGDHDRRHRGYQRHRHAPGRRVPGTISVPPAAWWPPRTRPPSSKVAATRMTSPAASPNSVCRSRKLPRTTTAKSSRNASPTSPAASPSSRSARPPSPSSTSARAEPRTRWLPPAPPWKRASSPAAASPCSAPRPPWTPSWHRASGDEAVGIRLVRQALEAPLNTIADNAGYKGAVIVENVRNGEGDYGFDADRGDYTGMVARGIIDPAKVARSALQNAGSVAGMLLTTQAVVTEIPKYEPLPADIQDFMHD